MASMELLPAIMACEAGEKADRECSFWDETLVRSVLVGVGKLQCGVVDLRKLVRLQPTREDRCGALRYAKQDVI